MNFQAFECHLKNESDREALLAIKDQMKVVNPPLVEGALSSWNDSLHFCKWQGVTCSPRHQRVMMLNLSSLNLEGSMSPFIGNLSFLRTISFQENNFYGYIPREIGNLFRLQNLNLSFNSFQGDILTKLITNSSHITVIDLQSNRFTGKIPVDIDSLSKLNVLRLGRNNLIGSIPPSLGNLSSLHMLSLAENNLEGSIPNDLDRLSHLEFFQVSINNLSGVVPSSIYNISSMYDFRVAVNQLHGSLPLDMYTTLPNLKKVVLDYNQFTGPLPVTLSNASKLQILDVRNNAFMGPVPVLGGLQNLTWLNLGYNQLGTRSTNDWSFISSLTNCSHLNKLALNDNLFGGTIPNSITNLSDLTNLVMGGNQLIGDIPPGIESLVGLIQLGLEENFLTGPIPSGIGKLSNLQLLQLSVNRLSGEIPSSITNITLLVELYLDGNSLRGSINSSLGKFQHLNLLNLSQNNLSGTIPKQLFSLSSLSRFLSLAHNSLTGPLPSEVGSLINLQELDISGNKLSGEIPNTFGNCKMLEYLRMNNKSFQGVIPSSLDALNRLLDLSNNELSGQVPKFLQNFTVLEYLNFSFNDLEGEIPKEGVFKNASAFSVVGNTKLCGGIRELELPSCSSNVTKEQRGSPALKLKVVVSTVTAILCITILLGVVCYWKRYSKRKPLHISSIDDQYMMLSYAELRKATEGFCVDNLIGVGSHGSVYKGVLDVDEKIITVKVLNNEKREAFKSFMAECETLRNARHRNLIKILTVCSSMDFKGNDFRAIVFEYMPNGNLDKWLHSKEDGQNHLQNLGFTQRLNIAIEVTFALEYLHHHCQPPIAHCDLKPSNILLDNEMTAHVGDFGLAKLLYGTGNSSCQNQSSSFAIKGSIGYVPPEYGLGGEVSTQGDVYSYGILLLEMFTGRGPTDDMFKDGLNLHEFAKMTLPDRVMEIVDPHLFHEREDNENNVENDHDMRARIQESLVSIVTIGVTCSLESPGERMEMIDVAKKMQAVRDMLVGFGSI